ncbi:MAG: acyl-CoA dehydrogenase family protein [Propionibacteriales bacterium]|nr:acyl-CoA dehydrogenase family protein [Propionibacteriales bacterium]
MNLALDNRALLPLTPSPEELHVRESVRRIVTSFGPRYARECFDAGIAPSKLWAALASHGFAGVNISEEWGGGGMGLSMLQAVIEETTASGGPALMFVVSSGIAGSVLERHGTPEQKERWLRGVAAGTMKMAFAITETDAGTNAHNMRTELRRDGDGYLLSGQKTFISGVEDAGAVLVVAKFRHPDGELGAPCLAIVDVDAPGFTRTPIAVQYMWPDRHWTLHFDDVLVESDRLIGGEESGFGPLFDGLNPERVAIAAVANGVARLALEKAVAYANGRQVWKTPIGAHQAVQHPLAKAKVELELARLMTQKAAALYDAGDPAAAEASNIAKYAAADAATHAVDAAIQTHGGNGLTLEYGVSDMYWLARLLRIAPINAEMVLNFVAQHSLGLPRSY